MQERNGHHFSILERQAKIKMKWKWLKYEYKQGWFHDLFLIHSDILKNLTT